MQRPSSHCNRRPAPVFAFLCLSRRQEYEANDKCTSHSRSDDQHLWADRTSSMRIERWKASSTQRSWAPGPFSSDQLLVSRVGFWKVNGINLCLYYGPAFKKFCLIIKKNHYSTYCVSGPLTGSEDIRMSGTALLLSTVLKKSVSWDYVKHQKLIMKFILR